LGAAAATTNAPMWWFLRIVFSSVFLLTIVLSIPISFDVGGRDSGLVYSLSLFLFYILYSALKLITPDKSRVRWTISMAIQSSQWIVIPGLLIWSLHRFAVDANNADWVTRTVWALGGRKQHSTWGEYFFGDGGVVEDLTIGAWDSSLRYSSPVFQMLEGFCTLLVIQAAGQITRWIVNRGRSDTWVLILLIFSASVIASAVYFLWRVALFPQVNNVDAIMIGVTVTTAFFLCAIGIGTGRGNPVESSLLFAYVVLCVYQIFTDYVQSAEAAAAAAEQASSQADFPPLPPIIMASYSTMMHMLGSLPSAVFSSLSFLHAAFQTIAPSVMISLTYRIIVFYCATRIIPAVRESGARALMDEPSLDDSDGANRLLGFLSWFSPSILIAVYTSLLLQHFSTNGDEGWTLKDGDSGGNVWRWVNVSTTMALYAIELYLGHDDDDGGVVSHWKSD
ncbi:er membrane protein, partial [Apiospora saccharicola]